MASYRRLENFVPQHKALDDAQVEQQLAGRSNDDLRIDLTHALEPPTAHYLEVVLLNDFEDLSIRKIAARQ